MKLQPIAIPRPLSKGPVTVHNSSNENHTDGWFDGVEDFSVATRLLALGQLYRSKAAHLDKKFAKNPPLAQEPTVKIEQPVVLVPGWKTTREAFDPLADKLHQGGRNGGYLVFVQEGRFYEDRACTVKVQEERLSNEQPKVFEVVFSDIRVPPPVAAGELDVNFRAIQELTGEERLDVSAYSMGGLATRCYLDGGGTAIDQLLILGTPHKGSQFAAWAKHVMERDIKWAVSIAGLLPADLPALEWLAPEEENPNLQGLNQRWPAQKAQVNETLMIGGVGTVSAKAGWWPITEGDGLVAASSVAPPGETPVIFENQHHNHLNNSADVYNAMAEFFNWTPDP